MYKLIFNIYQNKVCSVLRLADGGQIPFDPQNSDYQQYLAWVAEGNQPEPAEEQ